MRCLRPPILRHVGIFIGTKIVLHLKPDASTYADGAVVERVIQKYSNFVGFPIYVNGSKLNTVSGIPHRYRSQCSCRARLIDADVQRFGPATRTTFRTRIIKSFTNTYPTRLIHPRIACILQLILRSPSRCVSLLLRDTGAR